MVQMFVSMIPNLCMELFLKVFFCVMDVLPAHISVYHICANTHRGQKRVLDSVELELQMFLSHYMDARN